MTTAEQGPRWDTFDYPPDGNGQVKDEFKDTARLAVQEGKGISVRKEFNVYQGN